jgi:putative tricarboxylic transport membrane protein
MPDSNAFQQLLYGFSVALIPANLFYCFLGVLVGTLVGVLPGVGPSAGMCILLPITYHIPPASTIIMLAGIYYGAMYGGSTTSILLNVPGEAASVVTCLDGYVMARKGRAGPALGISAFGSFIGGTISLFFIVIVGPILARWALRFGAVEITSLLVVAFVFCAYLGSKSMVKAILMILVGLFLSTVGMDYIVGQTRFTYHVMSLMDGIGFIPVIMGFFGIAEVLVNLEKVTKSDIYDGKIKNLLPNLEDWRDSIGPISRGSILGFFLGLLPGGGATPAAFVSYAIEKKLSKKQFGTGVIEAVAGPETANNSGSTGAFVPLLSMGIPANPSTAILLGALMIHGVQPGPLLMRNHPDIFWGIIASMYIGNVLLLVLNLPLIWVWVKILKVPYYILYPAIVILCVIGAYSESNSMADVTVMMTFGIIGYVMRKVDYEPAPLVMAFVLGKMFENSFRQSLIMSEGSFRVFFSHPISAAMLIIAGLLLISPFFLKRTIKESI